MSTEPGQIIEDITLITSPYRQYIKMSPDQASTLDVGRKEAKFVGHFEYGGTSAYFVKYSRERYDRIKETAVAKGVEIRLTEEYLPRLEEQIWRELNRIQEA
jgi:hypothetical protein